MRWLVSTVALVACDAPLTGPNAGNDRSDSDAPIVTGVEPEPTDGTDPPSTDDTATIDTGTPDTTDTTDTGTDTEPDSPYAGCTGTRTDSLGAVYTQSYDADGFLASVSASGITTSYSWVHSGDVPVSMSWSSSDGSSGSGTYDAHGHATSFQSTGSFGTVTSTYSNTHDANDLLTHSVSTSSVGSSITDTDYDGCEMWTRQETDLFGDGSNIIVSTASWTYTGSCQPVQYVLTMDTGSSTLTYDSEGRPQSETADFGTAWTASWSWSCP